MESSYLGGMLTCSGMEQRRTANPPAFAGDESWWNVAGDREMFLRVRGTCFRVFSWQTLTLLIRGYARPTGSTGPLDLERLAEEIRAQYVEHGTLAVDGLEGSFSLALLDAQTRRVLLYRNLAGAGFTYYHVGRDGLLFGGNLADLVDVAGATPQPNRAALPSFFLYRFVPGRETLFDGFFRLLPGEQLLWEDHGLTRVQRQTFADWGETKHCDDPAEELEVTLAAVLRDCATHRPHLANLLSGSTDSSYLQAVWNCVALGTEELPASYSISVDHVSHWQDADRAMTASQALGTRHTLTAVGSLYQAHLIATLTATGEPPCQVPAAYFGRLAQAMAEQGRNGLSSVGADSLFGLKRADDLHNAYRLRSFIPGRSLRQLTALIASGLGLTRRAQALRLANFLDDETHPQHPVNQVAQYADVDTVAACFGREAVVQASAARRSLLDRYHIPRNPLDRLHAASFLGDALDGASLGATLFQRAGVDLLCPFLDSRMVRFAMTLSREVRYQPGRPKDLLKRALMRHVPLSMIERGAGRTGEPIFEWLSRSGQLRPLVERIEPHNFLDPAALARSLAQPNWFLYSLLCYDLWHKLFIERSLPRMATPNIPAKQESPVMAASR